jgi:hypothetical protein
VGTKGLCSDVLTLSVVDCPAPSSTFPVLLEEIFIANDKTKTIPVRILNFFIFVTSYERQTLSTEPQRQNASSQAHARSKAGVRRKLEFNPANEAKLKKSG